MSIIQNNGTLFGSLVGHRWPGARAQVQHDFCTGTDMFSIKFANGDLIQGADRTDVCRRADTHALAIKRLTGKSP